MRVDEAVNVVLFALVSNWNSSLLSWKGRLDHWMEVMKGCLPRVLEVCLFAGIECFVYGTLENYIPRVLETLLDAELDIIWMHVWNIVYVKSRMIVSMHSYNVADWKGCIMMRLQGLENWKTIVHGRLMDLLGDKLECYLGERPERPTNGSFENY